MRIRVFWGLYWGFPILGSYHIVGIQGSQVEGPNTKGPWFQP